MKQFLIASLLFLVATITIHAQGSAFKKIYLEGGSGPAGNNAAMGQIGLTSVFRGNWTASLSYYYINAEPKNLPSDYQQGETLLIFFPVPDEMPYTELKMVNLMGGRIFELGKKTWFTTEAGVSFGSGDKLSFARQAVVTDVFHTTSNYSSSSKSESLVGGLIRADFNWAFLRFAGLGFGFFGSFNSVQTEVGGQIKLMIGILNPKKKIAD